MGHAYFLTPSFFQFSLSEKEEVNERDKEGDFILFSPRFPLPPSLKGKKRKIKQVLSSHVLIVQRISERITLVF